MTLDGNIEKPDVLLGKTIAGGKYEIKRLIGEGAMGRVYLARQRSTEREVAIKVLTIADERARKRFLQEVRITSRINHRNIITIYDADEEVFNPGLPDEHTCLYMVMEYLDGAPLSDYVPDHGTVSVTHGSNMFRALPADEIDRIFSEICQGMMELGKYGIIHRDLKPENIFRCSDGRIVILDLGIARITADSSVSSGATVIDREKTMAGTLLGSLHCMSPEQLRGAEFVDVRTDVYAMACVLYFLCMGLCPYEDRSDGQSDPMFWVRAHAGDEPPTPITERRSDLPRRLHRIVMKGLARRPDNRFQTAAEFYEPFKNRQALSAELTPPEGMKLAETLPPPPPAHLSRPRSPVLRAAKLASLLMLSAAVGIVILAKLFGVTPSTSTSPEVMTAALPTPTQIAVDAGERLPPDHLHVEAPPPPVPTAEADAGVVVIRPESPRARVREDAGVRRRRRCPPPIIVDGLITNPCY